MNENEADELQKLRAHLHARQQHPDFEYETMRGARKGFYDEPPDGEGWERNLEEGRGGWERFDYHEEGYWRRRKITTEVQPQPT